MKWFALAVVVLALVVVGGLYAAGPEQKAACPSGFKRHANPAYFRACVNRRNSTDVVEIRSRRTNAWERISGAVTGD